MSHTCGWRLAVVLAVIVAVAAAACTPPSPSRTQIPVPDAPSWDEQAFAEHLRVLNGRQDVDRVLGSPGYGYMAEYLKDRMRGYMVQPALENRLVVPVPERYSTVTKAALAIARPDTLHLVPGLDFLPDGRSDGVRLVVSTVRLVGEGTGAPEEVGRVVMLAAEHASTERLRALRRQGAELALVVGRLEPSQSFERVRGLGVMGVSYQTAVRLLDVPPTRLREILQSEEPVSFTLPHPLHAELVVEDVGYDTYHVMGYVAGRHPTLSKELVLVCADLEALLPVPQVRVVDFGAFGRSTAALLETARAMARYARYGNVPERTLLFATWLDVPDGPDELASYLRTPLWALERTRAVIYVGLPQERVAEVEALLQPYGIRLHVVPPPPVPLHTPEVVLVPQGLARRAAERGERTVVDLGAVDMEAMVAQGATQALRMAAEVHDLVLREATTPAPFQPVVEDTLALPDL